MDLSTFRTAFRGFESAIPVPQKKAPSEPVAFLLGDAATPPQAQPPVLLDLNAPQGWVAPILEDFTQGEMLEIEYTADAAVPELTLFFNAVKAATEVRLDGVVVVLVRMRQGEGPLRAEAIRLTPEPIPTADQAPR